MTTENNVAAQAGDEPMRTLDERRAEHEAEAVRINAGRKPKFGDWMRNPWAGESNPQRDGMFVQSKRVTGKFNPGLWYEMTNGEGEFWSSNGKVLLFIVSPRATADVEREKLPHGHREDFYLMANASALAMNPVHCIKSMPNWVLAKELFATGSTSAHEICARAGIDPDGCSIERATTKPGA